MDTVGIVGAGQMGSGIAEVVAVAGVRAVVQEPEPGPLHASEERIAASLAKAVDRGKLDPWDASQAAERIVYTTRLDDLTQCQLVVEAVTEDRAIKCEVFRTLDARLPRDVILASNTSSIPITTLAQATSRPDRVRPSTTRRAGEPMTTSAPDVVPLSLRG